MVRLIALTALILGACAFDAEPVHHVNEVGNFCLTTPPDFEERRITIDSLPYPEGVDTYSLIGSEREYPVILDVGVNSYDDPPQNKMFVEYVWDLQDDGTILLTDRKVTIPTGAMTFPPTAVSLFFGADGKTLYYFHMDLEEDGFEELFVDIVGSFQLLQ